MMIDCRVGKGAAPMFQNQAVVLHAFAHRERAPHVVLKAP